MRNWQGMIGKWVVKTFGQESMNQRERSLRFIEEAIELVQTQGITKDDINKVMDRVYLKPVGDLKQEVGGSFVTLLALCEHQQVDAYECLKAEWERIREPDDLLQAKLKASQESKLEAGL